MPQAKEFLVVTMLKTLRDSLHLGLDILFPRTCALCRTPCADDPHFCDECGTRLRHIMAQPACPRCGHDIGPYGVHNGECGTCRRKRPQLDHLIRLGPYRNEVANMVRAFKYGHRDELDRSLAELLAEVINLSSWGAEIDALVFVPTHWTHDWNRPHYAPKVLTRALSRAVGVRAVEVMRRTSGGPHQLDVPRAKRLENIKGKFAMIPGADVSGGRICLIDDVSTTGATLNECARVLKSAGASKVQAAVIAKVDPNARQLAPIV